MARPKRITVKDQLQLLEDEETVRVIYYAYGSYYADTMKEQMLNKLEILDRTKYDCLNARVFNITYDDKNECICFMAEICA